MVYLLAGISYKMIIVHLDAGTEWTLSTVGILLKARLLRFAVLRSSLPQIGASLWSGLFWTLSIGWYADYYLY